MAEKPADRFGDRRRNRELVGTVRAIIFASPDDDFAVAELESGEAVCGSVGRHAAPSGAASPLEPGRTYRFLGRWDKHPQYGDRFAFSTVVEHAAHDKAGVVKYLVRNAPNVGEARALALWNAFGGEAVAKLRTDPAAVVAAGVLAEAAAQEASAALQKLAALEHTTIDLFTLFDGRRFALRKIIDACIARWGVRAVERVRKNPFALLVYRMPGAGFMRVDALYLSLGLRPDALKRQMLCIWHALNTAREGHTWHPIALAVRVLDGRIGVARARPADAVRLGKRAVQLVSTHGRRRVSWLATRRDARGQLWITTGERADNEMVLATKVKMLLASE